MEYSAIVRNIGFPFLLLQSPAELYTRATEAMPTFLVNHSKARTRSVQLDSMPRRIQAMEPPPSRSSLLSVATTNSQPASFVRSSQENRDPAVRHYRSMLVVDAPALRPLKPLDYSELYNSNGPYSHGTARLLGVSCSIITCLCQCSCRPRVLMSLQLQAPNSRPAARPSRPLVSTTQSTTHLPASNSCVPSFEPSDLFRQREQEHCSQKIDWLRWFRQPPEPMAPQECTQGIQLQRHGCWYVLICLLCLSVS